METPGHQVQAMFAEIAPQYDLLNRVLSLGIDTRWRRRAVRRLGLEPGACLLDLCCGTGDLALAFARTGVRVAGADFAAPMLPRARAKARRLGLAVPWVRADAQALPWADASFDGLSIAFGIRNVEDPQRALRECRRVLRPGGRLAVLEFFPLPRGWWPAVYGFYFRRVLPRIAALFRAGRTPAYRYLPDSVDRFVAVETFEAWLEEAGFGAVRTESLTGGAARLVTATALAAGEPAP